MCMCVSVCEVNSQFVDKCSVFCKQKSALCTLCYNCEMRRLAVCVLIVDLDMCYIG